MSLTRDQILSAQDIRTESVEVPEWGGSVLVKVMTGTEREELETVIRDRMLLGKVGENMRATLVLFTVVDESGALLFTQADLPVLAQRSAVALTRVAEAAQRINAMRDGDIEEAAKN